MSIIAKILVKLEKNLISNLKIKNICRQVESHFQEILKSIKIALNQNETWLKDFNHLQKVQGLKLGGQSWNN